MIKLFFVMIFILMGTCSLKAETPEDDQALMDEVNNVKNPFDNGIPEPKPVVVVEQQQPVTQESSKVEVTPVAEPQQIVEQEIKLPDLKLQGVIVGEDMHQAIINDTVVPLLGTIKDAQVISVTKRGVVLLYMDKKFFLKVE